MSLSLKQQYATVEEAAAILSIHPESVRRLIREKKLEASQVSQVGVTYLINRKYLMKFAKSYDNRPGKNPGGKKRPWTL